MADHQQARLTDIPPELMRVIGSKLAQHDRDEKWRDITDVIRDYCALSCVALCEIADVLADHICKTLPYCVARPTQLRDIPDGLHEGSPVAEMAAVLKVWGLASSGKKSVLWRRLNAAVHSSRIRKNVVPRFHRKYLSRPRRMCRTKAKKVYSLKDDDLAHLEPLRKKNRYGMEMKLFTLRELRATALAKQAALAKDRASASKRKRAHAARLSEIGTLAQANRDRREALKELRRLK